MKVSTAYVQHFLLARKPNVFLYEDSEVREGKIMTKVVIQMTGAAGQISGDINPVQSVCQMSLAVVSDFIQLIFSQCIEMTHKKEKRPRG
jgi:hypothetical protein